MHGRRVHGSPVPGLCPAPSSPADPPRRSRPAQLPSAASPRATASPPPPAERRDRPIPWLRAALLLLLLDGLGLSRAHAAVEDYGRLPSLEHVAISPGGTLLAFVRTDGDTRVLAVVQLESRKLQKVMRLHETKVRGVRWADEKHLLFTESATALPMGLVGQVSEWFILSAIDMTTGKQTLIPDPERFPEKMLMNVMSDEPEVRMLDGHPVVFAGGVYVSDMTLPALFRVDLDSGRQRLVREGSRSTLHWLIDEHGEVVAESNYFEREQHWSLSVRRDGHLREVLSVPAPIDRPALLGFGPEPGTLLISEQSGEHRHWRPLALSDGRLREPLAGSEAYDDVILDPVSLRPVGAVLEGEELGYRFFDVDLRRHWSEIVDHFKGERVYLVSATTDFKRLVVSVDGPQDGYGYFLVDTAQFHFEPIGTVYAGVKQNFQTDRVTYKAADGLEIPAYLTRPRNAGGGKLPLVVLVHGGPATHDTADFDWWSQALAEQGYAVLRPNYRGSDLDTRFQSAGYGEWGRKMQTDVSDGVQYLVTQGIADPQRVCIVGASYGGYAALAGVTLQSGIYRCAVAVAGIADMHDFLNWEIAKHAWGAKSALRYFDRFLGVSGPSDAVFAQISPARHVEHVDAPVLLIHGKDDTVVPYDQSRTMEKALRKAGKPVELVTLKAEDHWLSRSATRLQMLQSSIEFLRKHNPP